MNFAIRYAALTIAGLLSCTGFAQAQGPMEIQAIAGEPFGVGSIALTLAPEMLPEPLGMEGVGLSEKNGRVFYPAMKTPALANALKEVLKQDTPLTTGGGPMTPAGTG